MEKKHVLIVDDDKSLLRSLTKILRPEGYEVDVAETGREAIEKSKAQFYDLALLDIKLPDMEGTELLKVIDGHVPRTGKIIITGYPSTENAVKALNLEADAYLIKPIDPQKLLKTLGDIAERKHTEWALGERTKELGCLYAISGLVDQLRRDINGILKGVVSLIPSAWQYPDIACARIILGEKKFESSDFKETSWKQSAPIKVKGKNVGIVEVYYLEERPVLFEGPFLREERNLIDAIAERLTRIIERVQADEAVKRRLEIERTISRISSYFIGGSNIDDTIDCSLADLGRLSHASRAYMFLFSDDGKKMSNTHEWCAEGVTPQKHNLKDLSTEMFPWWMQKLRRGEAINIEDSSKLPVEARNERKILLEDQGIKSLLVFPLRMGEETSGFMGFDNVITTGQWSDDDVAILSVSSKIIGDAIKHRRLEDQIRNHADILEKRVLERTEEIQRLNATITERLIQKIAQINHISEIREMLRQSPGIESNLKTILDGATEDLGLDIALVLLVNNESGTADLRALKSKTKIDVAKIYKLDKPFLEYECISTHRNTSVVAKGLSILGTKSVHCAPICIRNDIAGFLATGSMNERTLDEGELSVLGLYSGLISNVLETARLTVEPIKEVVRTRRSRFKIDLGTSMMVQDNVELAYDIFVDRVMSGMNGLMITRVFPKKIREKYGLEKTPIIWLNDEKLEGQLTIDNIQDLSIAISNYLAKAEKPAILIDGIEYMISRNGFDSVMRFLQTKRSQIEGANGVFIMPIFKDALDSKEARLIQREFQTFKYSLREQSHGVE